jgi:hypothetical protein
MTSLTDRYVHATVRGLDEGQRPDVEQELRGTIEDMVDARVESGAVSREAAERDVLVELGDPMRLAAGYSGSPLHLIGPAYFPQWRRLVTLLLSIVVPIVAGIVLVVRLFVEDSSAGSVGTAFGGAAVVGLHTAVHIICWTTVVFAVIERSEPAGELGAWNPDQLPEPTAGRQVGLGESVTAAVMILFTVLAVVWQQVNPPVRVDGESVPVLDAGLWSGWMWVLLALLGGQLLVVWLVHRARRWTVALAAAGLVVDLAFAAVIVGLVLADRFFDGVFVEAVTRAGWESAARDLAYATVLSVVVIIVWDQIDTWRRVRAG